MLRRRFCHVARFRWTRAESGNRCGAHGRRSRAAIHRFCRIRISRTHASVAAARPHFGQECHTPRHVACPASPPTGAERQLRRPRPVLTRSIVGRFGTRRTGVCELPAGLDFSGDVDHLADQILRLAVLVAQSERRDVGPDELAIGVNELPFALIGMRAAGQ